MYIAWVRRRWDESVGVYVDGISCSHSREVGWCVFGRVTLHQLWLYFGE